MCCSGIIFPGSHKEWLQGCTKGKNERKWMRKIRYFMLVFICMTLVSAPWAGAEEGRATEEKAVLEEITITVPPYKDPVTPVETRYGTQYNIVTEEQIEEQNSLDLQSALRNVPGVMFQSKNFVGSQTSHSLYIRGRGSSHPSADFPVFFDGAPRYGALFGQVLGDGIAIAMIGGIEVFKSPQPSQFGNGYALLNVLPRYMTKEGRELEFNGSAGSYGTFDENFSIGVKRGPLDMYMIQSWMRTDGHRPHSGADQQSYYLNSGYEINPHWNVRLLLNYVNAGTDAPEPDVKPTANNGVSHRGAERYETETFFTTLTVNNRYDRWDGFVKGYYNSTDFDLLQELRNGVRYGGNTGGLKSRQEIGLYGVRGRETFHLWEGGEIIVGTDWDMTDLKNTQRTYTGLATSGINGGLAKRVWDFPSTSLLSPYGAVRHMVGGKETFHLIPSAGIRYYWHNRFRDNAAGQAGLVAGYGNTDLHISYGRGVIYPTPVALMNFVLESAPVSNAEQYWSAIKPEVVDHYEVSLLHRWPGKGSFGATVFRDRGKNRFQTYMFGPIPTQFNDPIGFYEIRGLELTGSWNPINRLEFFAASTWLDAQAMGPNRIETDRLPYTPKFQFQAGAKWTLLEKYSVYADMQHLRDMYQGTTRRSGTFNFPQLTRLDKLDDITIVNARLSYTFDYTPLWLKRSEIFVAVNNVFDQGYEYSKGYPMAGITVLGGLTLRFN